MDKQDARMDKVEIDTKAMAMDVKELKEQMKNRDKNIDQKIAKSEERQAEEQRERDLKKNNVVMYRVPEHENENATGKERIDWDRKVIVEIFEIVNSGLDEDDIKFCRRIGERGDGARPLIVGLFSEADKSRVLRKAKNLEQTRFQEVNIAQDLTKKQRDAEAGMVREAERRNEDLSEEDQAKNLR